MKKRNLKILVLIMFMLMMNIPITFAEDEELIDPQNFYFDSEQTLLENVTKACMATPLILSNYVDKYNFDYPFIMVFRSHSNYQFSILYPEFGQETAFILSTWTDEQFRSSLHKFLKVDVTPNTSHESYRLSTFSETYISSSKWDDVYEQKTFYSKPISFIDKNGQLKSDEYAEPITVELLNGLFSQVIPAYGNHKVQEYTLGVVTQTWEWINLTDIPREVKVFSKGTQSNVDVSINDKTESQMLTSSGKSYLVPPNGRMTVTLLHGDPVQINVYGLYVTDGEPNVYDETSTVNILEPNNYSQTVNAYIWIQYQVKYTRTIGTQVLFRRNDGIIFDPLEAPSYVNFLVSDDSTLTEINKTYRVPISLVANTQNKIEIFTRNIFGKVTGTKTVYITHRPFEDDGTGHDVETGEPPYTGTDQPIDHEPTSGIDAVISGQQPEVKDIFENLKQTTGQLQYFVEGLFSFLPSQLLLLLTFAVGVAVILRIAGR